MRESAVQMRKRQRLVKRSYPPPKPINLPEEIWQRIAFHLTAREWCRISGTCKTTWQLLPETIRMYPKDNAAAAGVRWVAKRWQVTRRLYLHAPTKNGLACVLAAMQESVPAALTYLDLAWGRHEDAPTLSVLLTWLAGRTERLDTLVIQAYSVHCLPPMLNLKHLVVNMSGIFSPGLAQSLHLLRSLETLDLTAVGCSVPPLNLSPLQRLNKLALFGAAPESLQLPPRCEVCVEVYCEETARRPLWEALLPAMASFTWHQEDFCLQDIEGLPGFLLGPRCPPVVRLFFGDICEPTAPLVLLGGLATARQLCITGDDVNVHMPARPSWGHIHLSARGALNLTFDDVDGLARRMPAALFQWWTAHGVGVLNLYKAFEAARGEWWYDVDGSIASMWNTRRNQEGLDLSEACGCGACTPCLRGEEYQRHLCLLAHTRRTEPS